MLLAKLEELYNKFDQVLLCDRVLFEKPLEEQKLQRNKQLDNIIKYLTPLVKKIIKWAKENSKKYKPINKHFLPAPPRIPPEIRDLL